jgi:nucleotide-binding universal stress UspA family protein
MPSPIKRILVPVDFSAPAWHARDYAFELARAAKAKVLILHVIEPPYSVGPIDPGGFNVEVVYGAIERAAHIEMERLTERLRAKRLSAATYLESGPAHAEIVDAANKLKADLIIMSTHGRTGLSHLFLGSVAERVVRSANCPVLTLHGSKARAAAIRSMLSHLTRRPGNGAKAARHSVA